MVRNFLGGALLVLLAGCASSSAPYVTVATANASVSSGIALNPGDQLSIAVFDEPNLTGEFQVDPAGSVARSAAGNPGYRAPVDHPRGHGHRPGILLLISGASKGPKTPVLKNKGVYSLYL